MTKFAYYGPYWAIDKKSFDDDLQQEIDSKYHHIKTLCNIVTKASGLAYAFRCSETKIKIQYVLLPREHGFHRLVSHADDFDVGAFSLMVKDKGEMNARFISELGELEDMTTIKLKKECSQFEKRFGLIIYDK